MTLSLLKARHWAAYYSKKAFHQRWIHLPSGGKVTRDGKPHMHIRTHPLAEYYHPGGFKIIYCDFLAKVKKCLPKIQDGRRMCACTFMHIVPLAAACVPDSEKLYFGALAV